MDEFIERLATLRGRFELVDVFEEALPDTSCCGGVNELADAEE
jgi:hypothetical protein